MRFKDEYFAIQSFETIYVNRNVQILILVEFHKINVVINNHCSKC